MNNCPLVSIIVPIYNVENELERCIFSLMRQTYKNIEIILIDDGSPDRCPILCDEYAQKDDRITVIHKVNGGLSSARNAGIDVAKGQYLSFVDSDDYIDITMIDKMMEKIIYHGADISICGRVDECMNHSETNFLLSDDFLLDSELLMRRILTWDGFDISACDKLFSSQLWDGIRFPEGFNHEDWRTIPKIIRKSRKNVYVAKPLYHYCHRDGSITTSINEKKIKDYYLAICEVNTLIKELFPSIDIELVYFNNYSYVNLWTMCEKSGSIRPERTIAQTYVCDNWKLTLSKMSRTTKVVFILLKSGTYSLAYKVRSTIRRICRGK